MSDISSKRRSSALWRGFKILFGAWAFAVAGLIVLALFSLILGISFEQEHMGYAMLILFLLGIPVMFRWLK